jgi:predicted transcriptional regulator of viral defense system
MRWKHLIRVVGDEPLFETGLLLAGEVDRADVTRQLSRWTADGHLCQLHKGLYVLRSSHQTPHPFVIANHLARPSYVSLQSALAYYGLILEYVPVTTSVTAGRPGMWDTPVGRYTFQHLKPAFFSGYRLTNMGNGQTAFIALPEKALLDLLHLRPGGDAVAYIESLRLQNLDSLDMDVLERNAGSPKLKRAVKTIRDLARLEAEAYQPL